MSGAADRIKPVPWPHYQLLDSGNLAKLEQLGPYILSRDEPLATHPPTHPKQYWDKAHASFSEKQGWQQHLAMPETWELPFGPLTFQLRLAPQNKHIGLFPEQAPQWQWLLDTLTPAPPAEAPQKLLNLFGHTGAATLAAAKAGYHVTHVDASKPALHQAKENQKLSQLSEAPIRWIHEDATNWVEREIKRSSTYHAILLDPPTFGRGPKGQIWKNERDLPKLLNKLTKILHPTHPHFLLLNHYTTSSPRLPTPSNPHKLHTGTHTLTPAAGPSLPLATWYRIDYLPEA